VNKLRWSPKLTRGQPWDLLGHRRRCAGSDFEPSAPGRDRRRGLRGFGRCRLHLLRVTESNTRRRFLGGFRFCFASSCFSLCCSETGFLPSDGEDRSCDASDRRPEPDLAARGALRAPGAPGSIHDRRLRGRGERLRGLCRSEDLLSACCDIRSALQLGPTGPRRPPDELHQLGGSDRILRVRGQATPIGRRVGGCSNRLPRAAVESSQV
jgi:hypothetical protein